MRKILEALALGLAAAGAVAAQDMPRGPGGMLMRADSDRDGLVTRVEYQAQLDARFAGMDANGNGKLDAGEGLRGPIGRPGRSTPPPPGATPPAPPPVGMTREAFRARALERFDRLDGNRDGRLDRTEIDAASPPRGEPG
jgi:hypothetical protein